MAADQTVGEVAGGSPHALEVLQRFGINHCCGAGLTLAEAAAASGADLQALLAALRRAMGAAEPGPEGNAAGAPNAATGPPPALAGRRMVHLDAREDIRRGIEPFARIMAAVKGLQEEEALVLLAPFEPIPLYKVLGRRGFAHWTERRAADDWAVWFYRQPAAAGCAAPADLGPSTSASKTSGLDVRGLEPPLPMVRILERLDGLGPGQELLV
ncbi:MAG TPA: DUF542 domain-containing protein, partial [Solirubrobacterales bacterium]|nr:DUF542 domain-containing protein [Solirubrobacterales bacterium]